MNQIMTAPPSDEHAAITIAATEKKISFRYLPDISIYYVGYFRFKSKYIHIFIKWKPFRKFIHTKLSSRLESLHGKEDAADFGAETDRVGDHGTESVQTGGVVTPWNPEFQVAAVSVFGFQVLFRPGYLRFRIHFRITALPVLESTADDGFPINDTVSFSDHLPVYGTGFRLS